MTLESLKEDSECAHLVREENLPPGTSYKSPDRSDGDITGRRHLKADEEEDTVPYTVAKFHEHLLNQAGYGLFHVVVLFILGLGLAADAVELFALSYILPSAEHELCMDDSQKGMLGTVSFIGMMIGAFMWGVMGDRIGRRRTLLTALATNGIFGVIAAFMPTYSLLMITRICSSIGIGGSFPIVYSFYSELLVRKNRGRHLSFLLTFWAIGGIFVAVLAWGILPRSGVSVMDVKRLHFGRWRVFLLICSLPAIISAIGTSFLPESPRFLLEMGRNNEALYIYKQILAWNNAGKSGEEYQLTELEVPGKRPTVHVSVPSNRGIMRGILRSMETFWESITRVFCTSEPFLTLFLLATWATASFAFYGTSVWLHEFTKSLDESAYRRRTELRENMLIRDVTLNHSLINTNFTNLTFVNVRFVQMLISHCNFQNCFFSNCTFSDIRSSRTYFRQCDFHHTDFLDTDLFSYKFQSSSFNSSFLYSTKGGCDLDFDVNITLSELFYKNLFAQLAILPGTLMSSYILDRIGRKKTLGASLLISGLSLLTLMFPTEKHSFIIFEAVFAFLSTFAWNSLDIISAEAYPANIRTTSCGIFVATSRLAAILGSVTFSSMTDLLEIFPIITSALVLLAGAVCVTRLPETKDYLV